jgi:hypothetical protein
VFFGLSGTGGLLKTQCEPRHPAAGRIDLPFVEFLLLPVLTIAQFRENPTSP